MSKRSQGPAPRPVPEFSANEPIEQVRARVHGRLLLMLMAMLALLVSFLTSVYIGRNRSNLSVEDCLPPGVSLATLLGADHPGTTVGQYLEEIGVTVKEGVLIDRDGAPIGFALEQPKRPEAESATQKNGAARKKMGMQSAYRVITISKFDYDKPVEGH